MWNNEGGKKFGLRTEVTVPISVRPWSAPAGASPAGATLKRNTTGNRNPDKRGPFRLSRSHLNARFIGRAVSLLAANQRVQEDAFLVAFPFDGQTVGAQATLVSGDEIPIGTRMLRDYRLRIDFPARTVVIETAN
jgi:hypothetical protein